MPVDLPFSLEPIGELIENTETRDPGRGPGVPFQYVDIASVCNQRFQITAPKTITASEAPSRARKVIREKDVVFATTRPYLKSIAMVPQYLNDHICSTGFCVLRAGTRIVPEWLFYCVTSDEFIRQITPLMRGANYPAVTDKDVRSAKIPVPSLDEQRRIVGRIKECLSRTEEIRTSENLIKPELAAVFPSILNQRFQELSVTAELETLETAAEIRGGQSLPKGSLEDKGDQSALLVKVGDMNAKGNERTVATSRAFLPLSDVGRGLVPAGAVIFPKRGGAIATNKKRLLGRASLLDPNLMAVVANTEVTRAPYLYYWCQTLDLNDLSNGGVIPQLNRKDLAPLAIPLPDLETQDWIVAELELSESACSELQRQFQAACEERKHLRESILRKAFAGEL